VAQANLRAAQASGLSGAFNVASGTRVTINHLAELVARESGVPAVVQHGLPRKGDVRHSLADIAAAQTAFGYQPSVGLEEGLREYMDWSKRVLVPAR
jgi:UDP-glucose 4-epimerase